MDNSFEALDFLCYVDVLNNTSNEHIPAVKFFFDDSSLILTESEDITTDCCDDLNRDHDVCSTDSRSSISGKLSQRHSIKCLFETTISFLLV